MVTALVTGCAGFIASHVAESLLKGGNRVIGVDNLRTGVMDNMSAFLSDKNFRFIKMDINDPGLAAEIPDDFDTIYHLAAIASVKLSTEDPLLVHKVNVDGTLAILELARLRNVKRAVLSSSAAVYGDPETLPIPENQPLNPLSPYAASKIAAESYFAAYGTSYGIESVILRYFNVYGPRQASSEYSGVIAILAHRASNGLPLIIDGDGNQTRSFIFVNDVTKVTVAAGTIPKIEGTTINISGISSVSILKIAEMIRDSISQNPVEITHGPPRVGDIKDSSGSMEQASALLQFSPETTLKEGLQKTLDWYHDQSR